MTTVRRVIARPAFRLAAALVLPAIVLLAGELGTRGVPRRSPDSVHAVLAREARALETSFRSILEDSLVVARGSLESLAAARSAGARLRHLRGRVEGYGIVDPSGNYLDWGGVPEEWTPPHGAPSGPDWKIQVEGLTTRLVASDGPDAAGRHGTATILLDSPSSGLGFEGLLPGSVSGGLLRHVEFIDADEPREDLSQLFREPSGLFREGNPASLYVSLRSPRGDVLALATLQEVSPLHRVSVWRQRAGAVAAVLFAILLATILPWGAAASTFPGFLAATACLVAARAALLLGKVPALALPREFGSASVFGSSRAAGLLGSPGDLLLSCAAVFVWTIAFVSFLRSFVERRKGMATVLGAVVGAILAGLSLALSPELVRDSRIPLLQINAPSSSGVHGVLLLALVLVMAAAAGCIVQTVSIVRAHGGDRVPRPGRLAIALVLLPIAAGSSAVALRTSERMAQDRLQSEFAPQVVEQSSLRRGALIASVKEQARSDRAKETAAAAGGPRNSYAAYLLWEESDLFHVGYKSSFDVYGIEGAVHSHFGFDLPPLVEPLSQPEAPPRDVVVKEETFRVGAIPRKLIHAEVPVMDAQGIRLGVLVGHVLDEPDNLPFLPWSAPYLSALGPGVTRPYQQENSGAPGYVLYDRAGTVLLSTLTQPPAAIPALWEAAGKNVAVEVQGADQTYRTLPLLQGERLHLLLYPELTSLDELGAFVRLSLLGLALLAVAAIAPHLVRRDAASYLIHAVRSSFYRKLLATLLLASLVPVVGLALFLRGAIERRAQSGLVDAAARLVDVARRVVEDYATVEGAEPGAAPPVLNDEVLRWLRGVIGQDIHLYENGLLVASSKRELFASGFFLRRLPGEVEENLVRGGIPHLVRWSTLGSTPVPVAYARATLPGAAGEAVVAIPLILQQQSFAHSVARVLEILLLATVILGGILVASAFLMARTVARPVRDLVGATARIAAGDYQARLQARTHDEVAGLVEGFNAMAVALGRQRADLERRKDYMETLLRHATTGVVSADSQGRIVTLNPAASALLSWPGAALRVGEPLREAVSKNPELAPLAAALAESPPSPGEPQEVDLQVAGQAMRLRVVRVELPDPYGGPPGMLILLDDVTSLMKSNQLAAWAEMARAIAHEIKNPLTPIQLSAEHLERLLQKRLGTLPPEVEACIETVVKQVRALREIASEFSAYAKLPALRPGPIDAAAFLREVAAPYRAASPPRVAFEERFEPAPAVSADRRVLARAVVNLIENALQAMPEGGVLTLGVSRDPDSGGTILSVTDTGPGLDPDVRRHLFEPYFSTKSSGTGLGLGIVRSAVEAHGGRISVDSEPGRGTSFHIHLSAA